jgi:selenium metabolism protein YedF
MAEFRVECQGLSCPQPVLKCKKVIDEHHPERLAVLVDNQASLENVKRFLGSQGYEVQGVQEQAGQWEIVATRREAHASAPETPTLPSPSSQRGKTVLFLSSDTIGSGDDVLGAKLMKNFLSTLPEMDDLWRIICVNSAVRLAVEGSVFLDSLKALERGRGLHPGLRHLPGPFRAP